ncbi:MAG: alpha/beta hydrolase [Anaerolineae bacterium]|nr:alpha/beta hydrolase [Anaerolineae bacterium]
MAKRIQCLLILLFALSLPVAAQDAAPAFRPGRCLFTKPGGLTIDCGEVTVPADRNQPDGGMISLPVAIIRSRSANPAPDPVVLLVGGPGGSALEFPGFTFRPNYYSFLADRDFILFDQRGVGESRPSLDCPNYLYALYEIAGGLHTPQQNADMEAQALLNCRQTLVEEGIDLNLYTTAINAADLDGIRRALGYKRWNLFGVSYGTKLALTAMRDYPAGIRSVILDSVYPLQANLYLEYAPNLNRVLRLMFDRCAAQPSCQQAYPDLETVLYGLVDEFNAEPVEVKARHTERGFEFTAYITGDMLLDTVFNELYRKDAIPGVPALIDSFRVRDTAALAQLAQDYLDRGFGFSEAFYYSVQCADELQDIPLENILATGAVLPSSLIGSFNRFAESTATICGGWGVQPGGDRENQPVTSAIPALILSGEFDPITPPSWGEMIAVDLTNSFRYVFPGVGHGEVRSDTCALQIALSFVNDPTTEPDSSCIASMPGVTFSTP